MTTTPSSSTSLPATLVSSPTSASWSRSLARIGRWILRVPPGMTDIVRQRQSRLLAAMTFTLGVAATLLSLLYALLANIAISAIWVGILFGAVMLVSYALNRKGAYRPASLLLLAAFPTVEFGLIYSSTTPPVAAGSPASVLSLMAASIGALILATIFLPWQGIASFSIVNFFIGLIVLRIQAPAFNGMLYAVWYIVLSVLLYTFARFRRDVERDRQQELSRALAHSESANAELVKMNAELTRARVVAQEGARLKSEFLNTMSHELRTPLNAITGFTGIMLSGMGGAIDTDAEHMLERIDANSKRLLNLINDVLDIAKIEAGRMTVVSERVVLRDLVKRWSDPIDVLARSNGLVFNVNFAPDLPDELYTDAERLTQIATNLLSNAVKFTQNGSVTLSILRQGDIWQIQVRDTGIGIPPHAINYIFEEFRQIDGSTKRAYGGTGLGLAIVRNLCRLLNGSVNVQSELGQGSTFTVSLPLMIAPESESAAIATRTHVAYNASNVAQAR
jgi:signal transduction histidine kinase